MINPVQSSISIPTEHHFQACQIKLTRGMKSRASVCVYVWFTVTLYDSTQVDALEWYTYVPPGGSTSSRGASCSACCVTANKEFRLFAMI